MRYKVTEQDGREHEHDDINRAIAKSEDGAVIVDTQTGKAYNVRKGGRYGDYAWADS